MPFGNKDLSACLALLAKDSTAIWHNEREKNAKKEQQVSRSSEELPKVEAQGRNEYARD
jgi:hypothetical protein